MSMFMFDSQIAKLVGADAATIFQSILFWTKHNKANGANQHDGRWWTYNSVKAWEEQFPHLSGPQIRRCLAKLEEAGLVVTGCYNDHWSDRRKWYAVGDQSLLTESANESCRTRKVPSAEIGKCSTDIIPDTEPEESLSAEPTPAPQVQSKDGEITLAVKAYNETAGRCGLPHVRKLTAARLSKLRARLKDCDGLDGWRDALAKLEASTHCTGGNDRGWRACLDFLLQESSFVKLIEGAYDDKRPKYTNGAGKGNYIDNDPVFGGWN